MRNAEFVISANPYPLRSALSTALTASNIPHSALRIPRFCQLLIILNRRPDHFIRSLASIGVRDLAYILVARETFVRKKIMLKALHDALRVLRNIRVLLKDLIAP